MAKINFLKKKSLPYFIAEIGFNHLGKINLAKKMVLAAKQAGADAVKFQTYIPEEMVQKDSKHYKILINTELTFNNYIALKKLCKKINIDFITTPFDIKSVKLCKKVGFDAIKIASMDLNNHLLIKEVAKLKKPIIVSTGMSELNEIRKTINLLKKNKSNFYILHCISNYPTNEGLSNLNYIKRLKKMNSWKVGFSDHTLSDYISISAITLGAKVIEKHFTCNKKIMGADNQMSYDTSQLKNLIIYSKKIYNSVFLNKARNDIKNQKKMRRYFFYRKNLSKKYTLKLDDLKMLRVNKVKKGLISVDKSNLIIGKKLNKNVLKDTEIKVNHFKK